MSSLLLIPKDQKVYFFIHKLMSIAEPSRAPRTFKLQIRQFQRSSRDRETQPKSFTICTRTHARPQPRNTSFPTNTQHSINQSIKPSIARHQQNPNPQEESADSAKLHLSNPMFHRNNTILDRFNDRRASIPSRLTMQEREILER